jgi:SAM-dependent methyltransferase
MSQTLPRAGNSYDRFAAIYNSHWGQNSLHFLPVYQTQALIDLPAGSQILDLCCGSGQFAKALTRRGYRVTGVDSAGELLGFARQNAPEATFLRADVRCFRSETLFDAAICVYDSLNHLLTPDDLQAAFETVYRCLRMNGVFAFDMNMEAKYRDSWRSEFTVTGSDEVYELTARIDYGQRLAMLAASRVPNLNIDGDDGCMLFRQTWYSEVEIVRSLKTTGFGKIRAVSLSAPNLNDPERMLFVCRKV